MRPLFYISCSIACFSIFRLCTADRFIERELEHSKNLAPRDGCKYLYAIDAFCCGLCPPPLFRLRYRYLSVNFFAQQPA